MDNAGVRADGTLAIQVQARRLQGRLTFQMPKLKRVGCRGEQGRGQGLREGDRSSPTKGQERAAQPASLVCHVQAIAAHFRQPSKQYLQVQVVQPARAPVAMAFRSWVALPCRDGAKGGRTAESALVVRPFGKEILRPGKQQTVEVHGGASPSAEAGQVCSPPQLTAAMTSAKARATVVMPPTCWAAVTALANLQDQGAGARDFTRNHRGQAHD